MDREEMESIDSNPGSVRWFRSSPPIRGPQEVHDYKDNDEEEKEKDDIAALHEQLTALKLRLNNMDERVAESEIDWMDLDDKVDTLRKAVCSKIKRLAMATGNEELYGAPNPRD